MPKRITVPEGHVAPILSADLAAEILSMCKGIRKLRRVGGEEPEYPYREIAGDLILAILEAPEAIAPKPTSMAELHRRMQKD